MNNVTTLESGLQQSCSTDQFLWFNQKRSLIKNSEQPTDDLQIALAMTKRKVGCESLKQIPDLPHWSTDEAARVLLILDAINDEKSSTKALVEQLYQEGDEYEKEAILKGLSLLDSTGELVFLAEDSCRTNIITLFSAMSQHNPYPAAYFSEGVFNQMVLKSLFLDINIEPIIGLRKKVNQSMSRMCFDYVRERLAAGRRVPASIWLTINLESTPQAIATFKQFIDDENAQQRYFVALSLSWQSQCHALNDNVAERMNNETDPTILAVLNEISK